MTTPAATARPTLLVPREHPGRPVDVATREPFIARQLQRGRRARHLRRALRGLGVAVAAGLVLTAIGVAGAAALHALRRSALLAVWDIEVSGERRLAAAAVRATAAIEPGTSLLDVDVDAVRRRVEALPGVRRARVVRSFPNRVALLVEEREPYALVNVAGAGLSWVDAEGYLIASERHGAIPSLPVLSGVEAPVAVVDGATGDRLRTGLALLRAVQRAGGRVVSRVSEIDVDRPGGPVLYTVDGATVWLGGEGWDERLARLDGVLGELEEHGERADSVDLRFRDLVVLRPHGSTTTTGNGAKGR